MFDFLKVVKEWDGKKARYVYSPSFVVRSNIKDLMTRSKSLYAIYDESTGLWETDDTKAIEMIDKQVWDYAVNDAGADAMNDTEHGPIVKTISDTRNRLIVNWHRFCEQDLKDHWQPLNQKVIFSNTEIKRSDYASVKLDYPLCDEPTPYYDKLCNVLYLPEERTKWEWFIGCIIAGDQKKIQKMLVFYGEPGTGKSTIIGKVIADNLFGGYDTGYAVKFEANNVASRDSFGTDFLEHDSVLAYDDDAELGVITSKTTLNKIISHEPIRVNCKFKPPFITKPNCLMIVGSNDPVQMSPNSGMNRRLIDVRPTGNKLDGQTYDECIEHIPFEKSGIAWKCLQTYKKLGKHYYDHYIAEDMLTRTSPFQNFVVENYFELKDGISLANAYKMYTDYAVMCNFKNVLPRHKFRDTLKLYFESYSDMKFSGFKVEKIGLQKEEEKKEDTATIGWLDFGFDKSLFDELYSDAQAQYAKEDGSPKQAWDNVKTVLKDLDTKQLHYVRVPVNHIVIDLDIKGDDGEKCFEKNLAMANKFPPTYAELSKSGSGIHLHYIYTGGDPNELSRIYSDNVEIKVFTGKSALRRKLSKCNNLPIAEICSGLPVKLKEGGNKVIDWDGFKNEKILRKMIVKNLLKAYHPATKPSVDFIESLLKQAYMSGATYDLRDMQNDVLAFAISSTHHADYCVDAVARMHFCSDDVLESEKEDVVSDDYSKAPIIFLDIETFPSYEQAKNLGVKIPSNIPEDTPALFLVNWKFQGENKSVTRMINPKPAEVETLFKYRIIGFNNKGYDNHMLYARSQGYTPEELFNLSQKIISGDKNARFSQAYNLSYTDVYDFASKKQGLKKWEIELKIKHLEWNHPWDQPVPVSQWVKVAEYCDNDVISTEKVFNECEGDFLAREILATVAGGTVNESTNQLTTKIVFGRERNPVLVYTDFETGEQTTDPNYKPRIISLEEYEKIGDDWSGVNPKNSNHFPGYHLVRFPDGSLHNMFRGVDVGRGGYVYANPGMYARGLTKDVASMHPHSIKELNLFGDYTQNYIDLMEARIAIKHHDYEAAGQLFGGALKPYLKDDKYAKALSKALKLALNSAYGMTSSPNDYFVMKDPRNINNIVALRGALVMKTLQDEVEKRQFKVIHIKTDSIKIADPTDDILNFIDEFGKFYGYTYEVEHTWKRICLVNDAVFIGQHDEDDPESPNEWEATGKQFQVPYIFKSLFTHEEITFDDMCETFSASKGALHLVFDEGTDHEVDNFVGRVGQFTPVIKDGGSLYRVVDDKRYAASGTKGYKWLESESVESRNLMDNIDRSYYTKLCDDAVATISKFGDFDYFVSDIFDAMNPPIPNTGKDEIPFDEYVKLAS